MSVNWFLKKYWLFLLGVIFDASIFALGYSYRIFFYETTLTLFFLKNSFWKYLIFFVISILKIIYIFFSVNIFSIYTFNNFDHVLVFCVLVTVTLFFLQKDVKIGLIVPAILILSIIIIDKQFFSDRLATSFIYSSYTTSMNTTAKNIQSEPYEKVKLLLQEGPVILINWESLGVPTDDKIMSDLSKTFPSLEYGTIQIKPRSTIASEFEYLCKTSYGKIDGQFNCLPSQYEAQSLHGNNGFLFNRTNILKSMGFAKSYFAESFGSLIQRCNYSFRGICDNEIFEYAFQIAKTEKPHFIYILTLDSHFPYLKYKNHAQELFQELSSLIKNFKERNLPYTLFIVGDHPPPLAPNFLATGVPYFIVRN